MKANKPSFLSVSLLVALPLLVAAPAALSLGGCSSSDSSSTPTTPVARGQALVASNDCARCHQDLNGKTLAGRTKPIDNAGPGVTAYGPNLTPDNSTGIGGWTDAQVIAALKQGKDDQGEQLCNTMPSFASLGDSALSDIVAYLRSLPAVQNTAPESVCPPLKMGDTGAADAGH